MASINAPSSLSHGRIVYSMTTKGDSEKDAKVTHRIKQRDQHGVIKFSSTKLGPKAPSTWIFASVE